jgi:hypothetical protein
LVTELATGIVLAFRLVSKLPLCGLCAINQLFVLTAGIPTAG